MDTSLILFSIVSLSLYNVALKRYPHKLLLLFWVSIFTYLGFILIYLFETLILQHDINARRELYFDYTFDHFPLYFLCILFLRSFSMAMTYSWSIPISQFGILLASAGYIALG